MALTGMPNKNAMVLFLHAPRDTVIEKLGQPDTTTTNEAKDTVDTYVITNGNEPSLARALLHITLDLLTFSLWELIGTPIELGINRSQTSRYIITYDPQGKFQNLTTSLLGVALSILGFGTSVGLIALAISKIRSPRQPVNPT